MIVDAKSKALEHLLKVVGVTLSKQSNNLEIFEEVLKTLTVKRASKKFIIEYHLKDSLEINKIEIEETSFTFYARADKGYKAPLESLRSKNWLAAVQIFDQLIPKNTANVNTDKGPQSVKRFKLLERLNLSKLCDQSKELFFFLTLFYLGLTVNPAFVLGSFMFLFFPKQIFSLAQKRYSFYPTWLIFLILFLFLFINRFTESNFLLENSFLFGILPVISFISTRFTSFRNLVYILILLYLGIALWVSIGSYPINLSLSFLSILIFFLITSFHIKYGKRNRILLICLYLTSVFIFWLYLSLTNLELIDVVVLVTASISIVLTNSFGKRHLPLSDSLIIIFAGLMNYFNIEVTYKILFIFIFSYIMLNLTTKRNNLV